MINVLIFPVHLFSVKLFPVQWKKSKKQITFYLLEDPIYWGTDPRLELNMNQLKLVLHRATMKYYHDYLNKNGYKNVIYQEEAFILKKGSYNKLLEDQDNKVELFDPVDHMIMAKLKEDLGDDRIQRVYDNPGFLLSDDDCRKYYATTSKGKKRYSHANFYGWVRDHLALTSILGSKTYDSENRKPVPKGTSIPKIPTLTQGKYVKEAITYIKSGKSKDNYGDAGMFYLPITHEECQRWFKNFLSERFSNFGNYQDAILSENPWVFHSMIAPMVNVGTLDVGWVLKETLAYYKKNKTSKSPITINNLEGFVRQIIGWREYSRFLYMHTEYVKTKYNHFRHQGRLTEGWYRGELGVAPVDWAIKTAFGYGYIHHIVRLMVMCNFMNLCELHPDEVFKWFMEFSMDSYQWVMYNNIYGMGTYADGGLTMSKPYLSSSNYILKMSNFQKDNNNNWEEIWKDLFYRFLYKHEDKLKGTPYLRNLSYYKSLPSKEKKELLARADQFIKKHTRKS